MNNLLGMKGGAGQNLTPRLTKIYIVSNRLFLALSLMILITVVGAYNSQADGVMSHGATTWMTLLMGIIGGFVGLQRRLKHLSDDDLSLLANSWVYVLLSPLVGGVLAVIIYILFISGLLQGDLFPDFAADESRPSLPTDEKSPVIKEPVTTSNNLSSLFAIHGVTYKDYAKLAFWCFLAGFSEKFVTNIISQFESKADSALDADESADAEDDESDHDKNESGESADSDTVHKDKDEKQS